MSSRNLRGPPFQNRFGINFVVLNAKAEIVRLDCMGVVCWTTNQPPRIIRGSPSATPMFLLRSRG